MMVPLVLRVGASNARPDRRARGERDLLALLTALLDGDPTAVRAAFAKVETLCDQLDGTLPKPLLRPIIDDWGDELALLRR